jgi:hypothetical protein
MRRLGLATLLLVLVSAQASAQDGASTTRVERRAVYGATVTEEQGVWVFRPIPPTRHMVIAPSDGPPVNLSLNQTEKDVRHYGGDAFRGSAAPYYRDYRGEYRDGYRDYRGRW